MARINQFITEPMSPYKLAQALSSALSEAVGEEVTIAPQQVYGAVRSGSLATERFDNGNLKVTVEAGNAFIAARLERQKNKGDEAEAEASADETQSAEVAS
jgi:hypothetical protein